MRLVDIKNDEKLFEKAFSLYEREFPFEERREREEHLKKAANENFKTTAVFNAENEFCGIVFYWENDRFVFLEHIAVERALRGRGYASDALRILKNKNKPVILEIEPPVDEKTEKRYSFYRKNGFLMNEHNHVQVKYHVGDGDLKLDILSFPRVITADEYCEFYEYLTNETSL